MEGEFQELIDIRMQPYEGELPEALNAIEAWELHLDGYTNPDGEGYTVRFLMPKAEKKNALELYRLTDGEWRRQTLGRSGSYVTFPVESDSLIFAVTERPASLGGLLPWIIAAAASLAVLIAVPVVFTRAKRKAASADQ